MYYLLNVVLKRIRQLEAGTGEVGARGGAVLLEDYLGGHFVGTPPLQQNSLPADSRVDSHLLRLFLMYRNACDKEIPIKHRRRRRRSEFLVAVFYNLNRLIKPKNRN